MRKHPPLTHREGISMLNEAKLTCRALDSVYEPELCRLIKAAETEIRTRGVEFEGTFTYTVAIPQGGTMPAVTAWTNTITDDWVKTAILTYVKAKVPWTDGGDKLMDAYEQLLDKMMHTTGYRKGWEEENDG